MYLEVEVAAEAGGRQVGGVVWWWWWWWWWWWKGGSLRAAAAVTTMDRCMVQCARCRGWTDLHSLGGLDAECRAWR